MVLEILWPEKWSPEEWSAIYFHIWPTLGTETAVAAEPAQAQALLFLTIFTVGLLSSWSRVSMGSKGPTIVTTMFFCFTDLREERIFNQHHTSIFSPISQPVWSSENRSKEHWVYGLHSGHCSSSLLHALLSKTNTTFPMKTGLLPQESPRGLSGIGLCA